MDLGWAALEAAGFGLSGPFLLRPAGQCLSIALAGRIFLGRAENAPVVFY